LQDEQNNLLTAACAPVEAKHIEGNLIKAGTDDEKEQDQACILPPLSQFLDSHIDTK